jgi:hypothetical protein
VCNKRLHLNDLRQRPLLCLHQRAARICEQRPQPLTTLDKQATERHDQAIVVAIAVESTPNY